MLYIIAIVLGLAIGRLREGRLINLTRLRLKWLWLIPVALGIQLLIFPLFSGVVLVPYATAPLHLLSYAILVVWLVANVRVRPVGVLLLGSACNFAAIAANGGYMPVSLPALRQAGLGAAADRLLDGDTVANVIRMTEATRLNVLGDWLYLPAAVPLSTAFSIGDVVLMIGIAWLAAEGMTADG